MCCPFTYFVCAVAENKPEIPDCDCAIIPSLLYVRICPHTAVCWRSTLLLLPCREVIWDGSHLACNSSYCSKFHLCRSNGKAITTDLHTSTQCKILSEQPARATHFHANTRFQNHGVSFRQDSNINMQNPPCSRIWPPQPHGIIHGG